ncbi:hypothetical protein [Nocardioides jishulii]|uniref:Uncharacterized protein n=1 Tax=Nocardioides jishulii TaxID=2575440 RepID=A0A4U2YRQ0_9ACTN|nr:hypothetical protein [Nocardioides jishulii]QCX28933.1 hypothetical protein FCL41_16465 [Nocardioides jishulii]TKI64166.1 hypothetical protein FC770_03100 [Nocardioides jishulii]
MRVHPAIAPLRILLVLALVAVIGVLFWASTSPGEKSDDSDRVAVPTAPKPLEDSVGQAKDATEREREQRGPEGSDGSTDLPAGDPADLPGAGEDPGADTIPVTGALDDYQAPADAARKLLRVTERVKYLEGYPDADRLKHAVVVCEKVAFQDWTWQQQVDGDVAFEVPRRSATRFAELLEGEFCEAIGL